MTNHISLDVKHIPDDICDRIYDILVEHTGAPEQYRYPFVHNYSNPDNTYKPTEFRVCSKWGMAGKFWWANDHFYVSGRSRCECSSDQEHGIELMECDKVNVLLAPLYKEYEQLENYHD